jgi:hypothetical protein
MNQYGRLFNSTRVPTLSKDLLVSDKASRHILVLHKGHMFTFEVLDKSHRAVSPKQMLANVQAVLKFGRENENGNYFSY